LNIVTGDESWIHHFDPEEKRLSMQYRHTSSPRPKKFKTVPSAGKILLTVFWDSQRVYMTEFLEAGNTVNSARYIKTIKKTYGGGCVELGRQHRRFCCCMTMQDRTLLAQRLMLWRRWSLRFSPIRPTALTWRQAISISFLTSRGISRGLISPQMMKWSKLWSRGSNKELLNSSLTACVNLFYLGKNVLNDKATMSKNKYVNL